jgi:hypothetical protein
VRERLPVLLLTAVLAACSTSNRPAPSASAPSAPAPTPTPGQLQRLNPNVIEDTPTYFIQRFKKSEYIRVDDKHIRSPIIPLNVEYFKEDDEYFYVYTAKPPVEESEAEKQTLEQALPPAPGKTPGAPKTQTDYGMPPADFEDLNPPRISAPFRLEAVKENGLPAQGMWRHSFVVADVNGDGIPDIVAPPSRLGGDSTLQIFLGDGHGKFARQKLSYTEGGKPKTNFSAGYGGVAVGDIDGDGKLDVVMASHGGGLFSLFGDGKGGYEVSRKGLPTRDFSSQAIVLADVNGDGRLDIIASADSYDYEGPGWGPHQLRVYLYDGARGWTYAPDALIDGAYSNCLSAWDYNGDGRLDVLTGSQIYGAVQLLWKNDGDGKFSTGFFPEIEIHGFHFAMAPGTFGGKRVPAFADAFNRATTSPVRLQAEGISVYSYENGSWTRHRIWRKKDGKSYMYALAMGDLDGDGLDDVVFADSQLGRLRIFLQRPDGSFAEVEEKQEPVLASIGQCIRLVDVDRDGRLDVIVSKTYGGGQSGEHGGWAVYLNKL